MSAYKDLAIALEEYVKSRKAAEENEKKVLSNKVEFPSQKEIKNEVEYDAYISQMAAYNNYQKQLKHLPTLYETARQNCLTVLSLIPTPHIWIRVGDMGVAKVEDMWGGFHYELYIQNWREGEMPELQRKEYN